MVVSNSSGMLRSIVSSGLEMSVDEREVERVLEAELTYWPDSSMMRLFEEPDSVVNEETVVSGVRIILDPLLGFESERSWELSRNGSGLLAGGREISCSGFLCVPDGPGFGSVEDVGSFGLAVPG